MTRTTRTIAVVVAAVVGAAFLGRVGRDRKAPVVHSSLPAPPSAAPPVLSAGIAGFLSGQVRTSEGEPVEGARVCATDVASEIAAQPRMSCVETDSTGHYTVALVATGLYSVGAQAAGFGPGAAQHGQPVSITWGDHKTGVDIVLEHGGARFAGRVLDATGGPIAGAVIRAMRSSSPHNSVSVESNGEGRFALWADPGPLTVMAEAVGYAAVRTFRVAPSSDVVIRLTPGSTLTGEVVAASGQPVPNIEVRAVPRGARSAAIYPSASSDAEGAFAIPGLEPSTYILSAVGKGWRGHSAAPVGIGLAQRIEHVRVVVSPAAFVSGSVVVGSSGEPCPQGHVQLAPRDRGPSMPLALSANVGSDGAVRFDAVLPGAYAVSVQCSNHLLAEGPTALDVKTSNVDGLVWKVETGLGLVVHVVDEGGRPVPDAEIRLLLPAEKAGGARGVVPCRADSEGRYEHPSELGPGHYTIQSGRGYPANPVEVDLPQTSGKAEVTLRLAGEGAIFVAVHTARGDAIDDVRVSASASGSPSSTARSPAALQGANGLTLGPAALPDSLDLEPRTVQAAALGEGRFRIGPLVAGRYEVRVEDGVNSVATAMGGPVNVSRGDARAEVILDRGGRIRGRVVDSLNQALPDIWVSADCQRQADPLAAANWTRPPPGFLASSPRVLSDTEGRFALDGLAHDGVCVVKAEQPSGTIGLRQDVRAGDDVLVTLPAPGVLRGVAVNASGEAIERFTLMVRERDTGLSHEEVVSAPAGRWSVVGIQAGKLSIFARAEGGVAQLETELSPGAVRDDVRLEFASAQGP